MPNTHLPTFRKRVSIPSKVFILGEYAVLHGFPALVATLAPRFSMRVDQAEGRESSFHPSSPLAHFKNWAQMQRAGSIAPLHFEDPFQGAGGFGFSTAQFAMAYFAWMQEARESILPPTLGWGGWQSVWNLYRELTQNGRNEKTPPSGADLVAQWEGGIVRFDPMQRQCTDMWPLFDWSQLLVFSAAHQAHRKVPTHEHLATLGNENTGWIHELAALFEEGIQAVSRNESHLLGRVMQRYASVLQRVGLEIPATFADRQALQGLPGVLGVKGAGALQADSILVLLDRMVESKYRAEVIRVAERRDLVLVSDGLTYQMGVSCQNKE